MKKIILDVFVRLKNCIIKKYKYAYLPYHKRIIRFLQFLKSLNYIKSYSYFVRKYGDTNKFVKVELMYLGQWVAMPVINTIKRERRSSKLNFFSLTRISKEITNNKKHGLSFLSTTSGILTSTQALKLNRGGKFLFSIK